MIDGYTLFKCYGHKVRLIDNNDNKYELLADFYESEDDSGEGMAVIGLTNGKGFCEDEIKSIEIID